MLYTQYFLMTHALLYSMCDLKAAQMYVQCIRICELNLYEFELCYNTMEVTKNVCYVKIEGTIDHCTVTKWLKNFTCFKEPQQPGMVR